MRAKMKLLSKMIVVYCYINAAVGRMNKDELLHTTASYRPCFFFVLNQRNDDLAGSHSTSEFVPFCSLFRLWCGGNMFFIGWWGLCLLTGKNLSSVQFSNSREMTGQGERREGLRRLRPASPTCEMCHALQISYFFGVTLSEIVVHFDHRATTTEARCALCTFERSHGNSFTSVTSKTTTKTPSITTSSRAVITVSNIAASDERVSNNLQFETSPIVPVVHGLKPRQDFDTPLYR